jgi:hypothetical protein
MKVPFLTGGVGAAFWERLTAILSHQTGFPASLASG